MTGTTETPRLLTPAEFAAVVKAFREVRNWSQEQLAEISGLSARTIQRVEAGQPAGFDTKRALAAAFELDDVDAFNQAFQIPSQETILAERERFEKENLTLKCLAITSGRQLAVLMERCAADLCTPGFAISGEPETVFAELTDCLREFRDCHDLYSEVQKLDVYEDLQARVDALAESGVTLRYATRRFAFGVNGVPNSKPIKAEVLYLIAFEKGKEPTEFCTAREVRLG